MIVCGRDLARRQSPKRYSKLLHVERRSDEDEEAGEVENHNKYQDGYGYGLESGYEDGFLGNIG
jgi:hypothetical protein